jgi:hypothetical protein
MTEPLPPSLAGALRPVAEGLAEPLRRFGYYGPATEPASDADEATSLLNYLGRRANWTPRTTRTASRRPAACRPGS